MSAVVVEAIRPGSTPDQAFDADRQVMLSSFWLKCGPEADQAALVADAEATRSAMHQLIRLGAGDE